MVDRHGDPNIRGDHEHVLYRKRTLRDFEAIYFEDSEETMNYPQKTLALGMDLDPVTEYSETIYCSCGDQFRKPETAYEHAKENDVLDEHDYDPEQWEGDRDE